MDKNKKLNAGQLKYLGELIEDLEKKANPSDNNQETIEEERWMINIDEIDEQKIRRTIDSTIINRLRSILEKEFKDNVAAGNVVGNQNQQPVIPNQDFKPK